jgi:hypothetical protein
MSIWDRVTSSSSDHDLLMLSWADKHPYLYTAIEIISPNIYVVATVIGVQLIFKLMSSRRR